MSQRKPWLKRRRAAHPRTPPRARGRSARQLTVEPLELRRLLTAVTSALPTANSHSALSDSDVVATFDADLDAATVNFQTIAVHARQSGRLLDSNATLSADGDMVTINPDGGFRAGELIQVSVSNGVHSSAAEPLDPPHVWQFRARAARGSGIFDDTGQGLGDHASSGVSLGDLDGDGDLDAYVANIYGNRVWLNDGNGQLTDSGQSLGVYPSFGVKLGDLDGDGDLDAFVVNRAGAGNRVWINDGSGGFTDSGQTLGNHDSRGVSLGDLDGDGDLDAFVVQAITGNRMWINDGDGTFSDSGQTLGDHYSYGATLGDLDGDGDLDAFVANLYQGNQVWFNYRGVFFDSGQSLGNHASDVGALGDLDNDGDLDAFVANFGQGNRVWLNDGNGVLGDSGQILGNGFGEWVTLGDIDADNDLDAVAANYGQSNLIWINDGGVFQSGPVFATEAGVEVALGDLDGDNDLDLFGANGGANRVFLNHDLPLVTLNASSSEIAENGGTASITAELSEPSDQRVTVNLALGGSASVDDDFQISSPQIIINIGATTGSTMITAVQDALPEPNETVIAEILSVINAETIGLQATTITIIDDDGQTVPDVTLNVDSDAIAEAGGIANFTATLSEPASVAVTIDLEITGTAAPADFTTSGLQIVVPAGSTAGAMTVTAVDDSEEEFPESVIVDIVNVTNGNEFGEQQVTTTIIDDDAALLQVTSLSFNASGFVAEFSKPVDPGPLNLYDAQGAGLGSADVVLTGQTVGVINGSIVLDAARPQLTFIKSGGPLEPDTYDVTLRSASNALLDLDGNLLDGDGDGNAGGDFQSTFLVEPPPPNAKTVSIPDMVRGPGQDVNLPADSGAAIPLSISDGADVQTLVAEVRYDPRLLDITGATIGGGIPEGSTLNVDTREAGVVFLFFVSDVALPAGNIVVANLQASVPAVGDIYREQQVIQVDVGSISNGGDVFFPSVDDDALHLVTYFGDPSANGRINAGDAARIARVAALLDSGFASLPRTDPLLVADISGNRRVNAADASLLARFAALIPVPQIPPIPGGIVIAAGRMDRDSGTPSLADGLLLPSSAQPLDDRIDRRAVQWVMTELEELEDTLLDFNSSVSPSLARLLSAVSPRGD